MLLLEYSVNVVTLQITQNNRVTMAVEPVQTEGDGRQGGSALKGARGEVLVGNNMSGGGGTRG